MVWFVRRNSKSKCLSLKNHKQIHKEYEKRIVYVGGVWADPPVQLSAKVLVSVEDKMVYEVG